MQLLILGATIDLFGRAYLPPAARQALKLSCGDRLSLRLSAEDSALVAHRMDSQDDCTAVLAWMDEDEKITIPLPLLLPLGIHPNEACICRIQDNQMMIQKNMHRRNSIYKEPSIPIEMPV